MPFVPALRLAALPPNTATCVEIKGLRIALYNCEGRIYATQDYCTHADASLSDGGLEGAACQVICPWHGARFDVATGKSLTPIADDLATYATRVVGDQIEVEV